MADATEPHNRYESPLTARNASAEMAQLFSPARKFSLWRKLWLELARTQRELGLARITPQAIAQMEATVDQIDWHVVEELERSLRHDVMAHVHAYEQAAPAAKGLIHLGATSQYVVDNTDLILMRDALHLIAGRLAAAIDALGSFAIKWKDQPALAYTHFQPAQLTTAGKRAALWAQDLVIDLQAVSQQIASLCFRGAKGTTGTQASFLSLFDGDHDRVQRLDSELARRFGFDRTYAVTGQTYPRKVDAAVVAALAGIAASAHKFCNDIRLLAGLKQIEEPFEDEQVGSSAMAYKRNPMRCERATGLARFVIALSVNAFQTAAEQWLERSLDDSSNKRLTIPEAFLATDGLLLLVIDVARGLVVYPKTIDAAITAELPFMATEEILMAAVRAGGDRQILHEQLRKHSQAAAEQVKALGKPNDLIARLNADPAFSKVNLDAALDAKAFVGRAPQQTEAFVREMIDPIRKQYAKAIKQKVELRV
jgi:adenylosuccinate lyase